MKVLVACADPATRAAVEAACRGRGVPAETCSPAAAGARLVGPDPPPIAVIDGPLAAPTCRDARLAGAPAFLVAIVDTSAEAEAAKGSGADRALVRPPTAEGLWRCLEDGQRAHAAWQAPSVTDAASLRSAWRGAETVVQDPALDPRHAGARPRILHEVSAAVPPPASADLLVRPRGLDEKYELLGLLGAGGMGSVYRARHRLVDELMAIKVIHPHLVVQPGFRERFIREAKSMLRVSHPNVMAVRDCGATPDGLLYLAMDLSPGRSLGAILRAEGRMPERRAAVIARQVAAALGAAHAAGVIHRDLKPDNILVEAEDRVKVCDFGLAKLQEPGGGPGQSAVGTVVGTPHVMAPEQAAGRAIDGRADLYSLGCIIYEMVCGVHVFEARSASGLLKHHLREPPVPPSQRGARIGPRLEALVLRLLAKSPDERPASAQEVVDALEAIARPSPSRSLSILVADDSAVARAICAAMLARAGHRVELAADGNVALARATAPEARFDVILLDGEMPGLDGPEVAARIRAAEATRGGRTPIVAMGSGAAGDEGAPLPPTMDDRVQKPIAPEALASVLARVAVAEPEAPVLDRATALRRLEGDESLLRELVGLLLQDLGRLEAELASAAGAHDLGRVVRAAHELKGAAASCGAVALSRAAARLEAAARSGDEAQARAGAQALARELARTKPALAIEAAHG